MRIGAVIVLIFCCSLGTPVAAAPTAEVKALLKEANEAIEKAKDTKLETLKELQSRLQKVLPDLKKAAAADGASDKDKVCYADAKLAEEGLKSAIAAKDKSSISDFIKNAKPMTAVLFSTQDRNRFEVVKDPLGASDATIGIINQSGSGDTAGILVAAEAPFAFPDSNKKGTTYPIGAWFGVNLTTGGGDDVSDVDLAAGFSVSFITGRRRAENEANGDGDLGGRAKLLLGVIYGDVVSLGAKNGTSRLQPGDPFPLGEDPPTRRNRKITVAFGIGFRF